MLEWLLFIFYLLPCLHPLISWQFSLREITLHTQHGWWFLRPKQDVPSTEFQLIHLRDFLHLIEGSVKQISLAAGSKNRSGKTRRRRRRRRRRRPGQTNERLTWPDSVFVPRDCCNYGARIRAQRERTRVWERGEAGQQPAYTHCLFWTRRRLIYTC